MPSESDRKAKKFIIFALSQHCRIMHFVFTAIFALLQLILPVDSKGLLLEIVRKCNDDKTDSEDRQFCNNVIKMAKVLPKFSLQRKTLEAVLSKTYKTDFFCKKM